MGGQILEYEAKTLFRQGMEQGEANTLAKLSQLIAKLMENNRSQDILRATQDEEFREKLYAEYCIRS